MKKLSLYENLDSDIYENLAIEEYLMNNLEEEDAVLFLWSNAPVVVIGRNQNPHKECQLEQMQQDGILLARRRTGGGAVYQDHGNLNFTYICHASEEPLGILSVIISYLAKNNVFVRLSGRNDIITCATGQKISGVAAVQREDCCLVHGTLLVDVELEKMEKYLKVSDEKLKGLPSVKSRVTNIAAINPALTIEKITKGLQEYFIDETSLKSSCCKLPAKECYSEISAELKSADWIYGTIFSYDYFVQKKYNWGEVSIYLKLQKNVIKDIRIFSDSLVPELIESIEEQCKNQKFSSLDGIFEQIAGNIKDSPFFIFSSKETDRILADIKSMFC